ncbi:MAG: hypothetical protein ACYTGN_11880 [Planctomycetota bacterium]
MRIGLIIGVLGAAAALAGPTRSGYGSPDLLYFERSVAGDLNTHCASCHSDPDMASKFYLAPLDDLENPDRKILLRNFRAAIRHVDPEAPDLSRLLKKALGEGGHPGGAAYKSRTTRAFERLQHFALGATLRNRPPEAIVQKRYDCRVADDLQIDGTLSGDPDGNPLHFRWSVIERPPASIAGALGDNEGGARFKPDLPGVYRVELSVFDGRLWSLPANVMVVAHIAKPKADSAPPMDTGPKAAPKAFVDRRLDGSRLKLIRRLFLDLKRRTPYLREYEAWYAKTHAEMVDGFLRDQETWTAWYEQQLYYFLLLDSFRPKEGRISTIPARVTSGSLDVVRALEEIVRSQYFGARNPGNDTFVTVVLEQCLGLVVQEKKNLRLLESGKKMYDGYNVRLFRTKGNSQADFVRICFRQGGFFEHLAARSYEAVMARELDKKRRVAYAKRLQADPHAFKAILREWLTSKDYVDVVEKARTKAEIPYVRGLFVDALGRLPSYEELRNVRNAFLSLADPTPVRLVMGRVLLQSREAQIPANAIQPKRFVREQFVRLFARPPTEKEQDVFVGALKDDPQVTPAVVLWTLISSPEYQTY